MQMLQDVPSIYQKVEWIGAEGTSHPYIDTGLLITVNSFPEATVHFYSDKNEAFVFGARYGTGTTPYFNLNVMGDKQDAMRLDYGKVKPSTLSNFFIGKTGEKQFDIHNYIATCTDVESGSIQTQEYTGTNFDKTLLKNVQLFAVATGNNISIDKDTGSLRIYSASFWLDGTLVRDFVPCVRKSDNIAGMYDKVTKQFFTSVNSNTFSIPT